MKIEKNLPFEMCESCCECILDVQEKMMFSDFCSCQMVVVVGCKNERLCRMLKEKHNEQNRRIEKESD